MNPWHTPKYQPPEGDRAQADNEQMMREGSRALLIAIAYAQAEREERLAEFYTLRGRV